MSLKLQRSLSARQAAPSEPVPERTMKSSSGIACVAALLALCVELSQAGIWNSAEKVGYCPQPKDCNGKNNMDKCHSDATCNGPEKCCPDCGKKCLAPIYEVANPTDDLAKLSRESSSSSSESESTENKPKS